MAGAGPLTLLGMIAILPLLAIVEYLQFMKNQSPRGGALAMASHGAVMVVVTGLWLYSGVNAEVPKPYNVVGPSAALIFGGFCFIVGASRSQGPRDSILMGRAVLKILMGCSAVLFMNQVKESPFVGLGLAAIALWCGTTGLVKFVLLLRGRRAIHEVDGHELVSEQHAHGDAQFVDPREASRNLR